MNLFWVSQMSRSKQCQMAFLSARNVIKADHHFVDRWYLWDCSARLEPSYEVRKHISPDFNRLHSFLLCLPSFLDSLFLTRVIYIIDDIPRSDIGSNC
jgi:hypothetical protein